MISFEDVSGDSAAVALADRVPVWRARLVAAGYRNLAYVRTTFDRPVLTRLVARLTIWGPDRAALLADADRPPIGELLVSADHGVIGSLFGPTDSERCWLVSVLSDGTVVQTSPPAPRVYGAERPRHNAKTGVYDVNVPTGEDPLRVHGDRVKALVEAKHVEVRRDASFGLYVTAQHRIMAR